MNPIDFINNGYLDYLKSKINFECRIFLQDGTFLEGMLMGIHECGKLLDMEGFINEYPIHKLLIMHRNPDGTLAPVWINILLIDNIESVIFK